MTGLLDRLAYYEQILNSAGEGICQIDADGRTRFVNPAAARLLGWEPAELIDRPVHDVLHGAAPVAEDICPIHAALVEGEYYHVKDDLFWTREGTSVPVEYICTPIRAGGEDGPVAGAVITFQDIGERRDMERAIVQARDAAIESARLKAEFLANVSHEIRTPLNGIIGMTGLLLDSALTAEQRRQAKIVESSANTLLAIINDLLDFSRIEAGKMRFEEIDFTLAGVIDDTLESFASRAQGKGLRLGSILAADLPIGLRGDPGRLRQVFTNLLGNALKFTERGEILLRAAIDAERDTHVTIRFDVTDTGIGISPYSQTHLFQPFTQADGSTTRLYGGTGLGLAISKKIVEQMAGTIGVESEAGRGSRFWFTATFAKQPEEQRTDSERRRMASVFGTTTVGPLRVLVVEDNSINQRVAMEQLRKLGYAADAVADGHEALEAVALIRYDAVLMDCQMPKLDGYDTTRELRRREGTDRHTTIIAITASAMAPDRQKCLDAGMDDYIAKPVLIEELERVLHKYLPRATSAVTPGKLIMRGASPA